MKHLRSLFLSLAVCAFSAAAQNTNEVTVHNNRTGSDVVIDLPEGMTYNVDSLLNEWHAKSYLYPDTTCANPDYNPPFEPEVYQNRLSRIPAVMEMPYNEVVQTFIDQYSGRLRRSVSFMLAAGNFYVPIFEEALDYYGLPLELKYLPVIESALDPTAVSRVGATGLWQFMLPTATAYDLEVNSLIDERRDPIKSSWAAAKYLKDLYKMFGDWNLVIAAYNCGPGNVNKAITRANGVRDYWEIYPYLTKETRGYVPTFIAANYIMNYYCEHNICPMKTKMPALTDTIVVSQNFHMEQISKICDIDIEAVRALNPQYRTSVIPGHYKPCTIRLPQEKILTFIELQDSVANYRADELLARRHVVPVNSNTNKTIAKKDDSKNKKNKSGGKTVTVRRGDTLGAIAARNGTTVKKIKRLNGLRSDRLQIGQKLRVR